MIRNARKEDCPALYELVLRIFQDMELPILQMIPPETLKEQFVRTMELPNSRYSFKNAVVEEVDGTIAGCCFGFRGADEEKLNEPIQQMLDELGMSSDIAFYPDPETQAGEWYLDSLIIHENYRRKGIAQKLLAHLPQVAIEQGEKVIGLNCEIENVGAHRLYEKLGYVSVGEHVLAGHVYDHMQLQIQ